jgi:hypothetical protein
VTHRDRTSGQRRDVLPVTLVRAAAGALMLAGPGAVARAYGAPPTPVALAVVRVLGARHALQAALTYAFPGPPVPALGALVDLSHALTAVAWAATSPSRRRPGLTSAVMALLLAAGGGQAYRLGRRAGR